MKFEHCNHLGELELEKKETPGCRLYHLPDGQWVPSITSVTSFYNRQIFIDWRKRVCIEEANRITKKATTRGTDFHEAAQAYWKIEIWCGRITFLLLSICFIMLLHIWIR